MEWGIKGLMLLVRTKLFQGCRKKASQLTLEYQQTSFKRIAQIQVQLDLGCNVVRPNPGNPSQPY